MQNGENKMKRVRSGEALKEYRESYRYREEYFKRNPGLFGRIWFCSQCYRPLFGKKQVVVDHIVPLARGGRNHVSNCTAICQRCNSSKSDKVDIRVAKGKFFKFFESNVFRTQRGVGAAASVGVGLTVAAASVGVRTGYRASRGILHTGWRATKAILGFVTIPLRKGKFSSRLFFMVVYSAVVLYLLYTYTDVLRPFLGG